VEVVIHQAIGKNFYVLRKAIELCLKSGSLFAIVCEVFRKTGSGKGKTVKPDGLVGSGEF